MGIGMFQRAVAVWCDSVENRYHQFVGFYRELRLLGGEESGIRVAVAARSYYRLFVNGEVVASGPARTAEKYCRVDQLEVRVSGEKVTVAIEVYAPDKPERYSNDCTLEPGMLTAEIVDDGGSVLAATGEEGWWCMELGYRRELVETMSHSRGIIEYYDLNPCSYDWRCQKQEGMRGPVCVEGPREYLERRAPYASYREISMESLMKVGDVIGDSEGSAGFVLGIARMFQPVWYGMIPEENLCLEGLRKEAEAPFSGKMWLGECGNQWVDGRQSMKGEGGADHRLLSRGNRVVPGDYPAFLQWGLPKSELGFLDFWVEVEQECVLDLLHSDHLHESGMVKANSYVTRYVLQRGRYHLTTFEPKLVRYLKVIVRTRGEVWMETPRVLDDAYPDDNRCFFTCSDGELNQIYEAARRTLRLNTLDIFMDCPQRERGGWLCDSQFTAHGAWQLFGDLSVETDFIENFMLTDPDVMWHSFFPEVYPGCKQDKSDPGIANWSFWLLTELYEYAKRSGDDAFIQGCRERVHRFIDGMLALRGESGLLEGMKNQFVDWSLSNRDFCLKPISIPNNCLAVAMLEKMAELYGKPSWKEAADGMREVIEKMDEMPGISGGGGDGAVYEDGRLRRLDCATESGIALEIWSGFHTQDKAYLRRFINSMGTCPKYRADPNLGRSNLFIGLLIRFDVLARLGRMDTLVRELKDVYLPQIKEGSGTLYENYAAHSGCHGFNGAAGAMLVNGVLGLGQPMQSSRTIRICPNPGDLQWAFGSALCEEGPIYMNWSADPDAHCLTMMLLLPEGWTAEYELPFSLNGWRVTVNGELVSHQ